MIARVGPPVPSPLCANLERCAQSGSYVLTRMPAGSTCRENGEVGGGPSEAERRENVGGFSVASRMTRRDQIVSLLLFLTAALRPTAPRPDAFPGCADSGTSVERSTGTEVGMEVGTEVGMGVGVGMETGTGPALRASASTAPNDSVPATALEELEIRLSRLERRLRAVEQPVWQLGFDDEDWEICAEGPCRCQPETKSVSCWRQNLLDLPAAQLVPRDVLKLDLGGNRLAALHRDTFLDMTRLNHLDLSDNSIEHLPLNLFFSLHAVTRVRLSNNLIRELHRSQFLSTRNLRILDASSNGLRTLPESLFLGTNLLVLLDLSCNRISMLTVGTFRGLTTLEELLLGKNRLSILPADLFADLANLSHLGLEENRLKELPSQLFRAQASLRELNARGNQLTEISGNLLGPLARLRFLEMSGNKIARVDPSAFESLTALRELELGHNRMRSLAPGLFARSAALERLVLYANGIESLPRGAFRGLRNLTSLFLHSNHLRTMDPGLFQDTPNLRKLQLESNYLTSLPPRILDAVPLIEQLRLARNPWHCDCAASYLALWLQRMYLARVNDTTEPGDSRAWEFGAGAVCRGPGTLGGRLLLRLTFHELCEGQWASMKGLAPRIPFPRPGHSLRHAMDASASGKSVVVLLRRLLDILQEENAFDPMGREPVLRFVQPEELQKRLSIELIDRPASEKELEDAIRDTIRYSARTFSPRFHNQLYAGIDEYGLAGSWLTDVFNTSQYTYEVAPVFTLMERQVIARSLELVGYPTMPEGDGIMCPGGSMSNMYGMVIARRRMAPEVKTKGLAGLPPLVCFTSEAGHYSIAKGAHWLGLGTDQVYKVKCDELGRMRVDELRAGIAAVRGQGRLPFFVNATGGTTVLGAIDPLTEIAAVCRAENLWLHVDACLGGTLLLSEKYRDRLRGIELSDSVAWNPHKMLGAPFQCSVFLVKGKNVLHETNCAGARYLFQQDKHYDVAWDTGDKSVQCGRKVDAAKFWLMWKARGTKGLRESVDLAVSMADYFYRRIEKRDGFRLVLPRYESCNICFWYVPPSMRARAENEGWWTQLYTVTAKIKERMMVEGSLMVGYTPLSYNKLGNFFRMVVTCQPPPDETSMDYVIDAIERLGADL